MKRFIIAFILLIAGMTCVQAQSFEEYKKKQQEKFNSYKTQKEADFEAYRARVNAEYAEYMRRYWVWLESKKSVADPRLKIKDIGPVDLPDLSDFEMDDDTELDNVTILPIQIKTEPLTVPPIKYKAKTAEKRIRFMFYGTPCEVRFDPTKKTSLANARENAVADMWKALSTDDYNNVIYDLLQLRKKLQLCDWAYLKLTETAAETIYGAGTNEAVVMSAFVMTQSGYKIRMGRTNDEKIHLLVASADGMYSRTYWTQNGSDYYLSKNSDVKSLYFFDYEFPDEKSISLAINQEQLFLKKDTKPRVLRSKKNAEISFSATFNENTLQFYTDYPKPFPKNNPGDQYYYLANTPVSQDIKDTVYPYLKRAIAGKSEEEAGNIIINFMQTALVYEYDDKVWGAHRAFFPEETLFYPYCDCEDRAILFTRLVRDLMGLEAVILHVPGHALAAVHFHEDIKGTYIMLDGKKFLVCEPTFLSAMPIGTTGSNFDISQVKVEVL